MIVRTKFGDMKIKVSGTTETHVLIRSDIHGSVGNDKCLHEEFEGLENWAKKYINFLDIIEIIK